jgi:hypothetical protein
MRVIILGFKMEFVKFNVSYLYFQACTRILSIWAVENLGDLQFTCRDLYPAVKCEIHTIPILMHQMRISIMNIKTGHLEI